MNKYRNEKIARNGEKYDSIKEANRHGILKLMERAGKISNLQRQVKYELLPAQRDTAGKVIERAVSYAADFVYWENGKPVVEDVKSPITRKNPEYIIKRKLMLYFHGIRIKEV